MCGFCLRCVAELSLRSIAVIPRSHPKSRRNRAPSDAVCPRGNGGSVSHQGVSGTVLKQEHKK